MTDKTAISEKGSQVCVLLLTMLFAMTDLAYAQSAEDVARANNPLAPIAAIENTGPLTKKRVETCDDEFAAAAVGEFLATLKEFPPRQKAASFSIDQVVDKLVSAASGTV